MSTTSIGDLAQAFALRQRNTVLRNDIIRYNNELTTGVTTDLASHLGGTYSRLTQIERDIRLIEGYRLTTVEAGQYSDMIQERLEQISQLSQDFSTNLLKADFSNANSTNVALATAGELNFEATIDTLNSQLAGRSLFSGDAVDRGALVDGATILTEIRTNIVNTATTADQVESLLQTWFDDPAGFDTFAYTGSDTDLAPFRLSDITSVSVNVKAKDPEIKAVLMGLALASLGESTQGPNIGFDEQGALFRKSAERLLSAQTNLIGVQATVGLAQERIEDQRVRINSEILSLDNAKGALLAIDPFEAATRLEAAQFQLESLYTVTTRLSQLSLVNFLR